MRSQIYYYFFSVFTFEISTAFLHAVEEKLLLFCAQGFENYTSGTALVIERCKSYKILSDSYLALKVIALIL